ncbi:MAG: helix-turn-helix transcriptional regulator [Clostridiales bacterium]|nr:helix-turn-helix transcriptional regulator [Clostridiales bacterium]
MSDMYEFKYTFGERLRALRQSRNLGQIELAKQLDVGKSIISLWEQDKCEPTLSKLIAISAFFGVTIDYLAGLEN